MHIPDGYLGPSTCAELYAVSAPFWFVALRRAKRELSTRTIPLLSLFSAFSFVTMMFNLPLPGGTTGHAVGMGVASIVLGPWVSMLAISAALLIQALFFGDGGLTTFGANSFNMAIVGSLVAFGVYRLLSRRAEITSARRVFAAGLAGYTAINVSAFCAAVEFGVQPLLFHDPSGAPLYAPYPLSVSIPAMMIGHLTFAGLAELVLSAGIVRYLQRADPTLLERTAPDAAPINAGESSSEAVQNWSMSRGLWIGLALLLVLSPLGILAIGSAWGEWRANDFSDPAIRQKIAAVSSNQPPPPRVPKGLEGLSSFWKAPIADYAPSFVSNTLLKYFTSAVLGVALVVGFSVFVAYLLSRPGKDVAGRPLAPTRQRRRSYIEHTIQGLINALQQALQAEDAWRLRGFLQSLDPRVKLVSLGALIVSAVAVRRIWVLLALFGFAVLLAIVSRIAIRVLATRVWITVLAFTGVIALPALLLIRGQEIFRLPLLSWTVTQQGVTSAAFLIMRAETAATLSLLLILATPWNQLLRALRFFRAPVILVVIIETTYRFVFVLIETVKNMLESRQARSVGYLAPSDQRRFAAGTIGVLLDKSLHMSGEVHTAMQARGFRGEPVLLDQLEMRSRDWLQLIALLTVACFATWLGR